LVVLVYNIGYWRISLRVRREGSRATTLAHSKRDQLIVHAMARRQPLLWAYAEADHRMGRTISRFTPAIRSMLARRQHLHLSPTLGMIHPLLFRSPQSASRSSPQRSETVRTLKHQIIVTFGVRVANMSRMLSPRHHGCLVDAGLIEAVAEITF